MGTETQAQTIEATAAASTTTSSAATRRPHSAAPYPAAASARRTRWPIRRCHASSVCAAARSRCGRHPARGLPHSDSGSAWVPRDGVRVLLRPWARPRAIPSVEEMTIRLLHESVCSLARRRHGAVAVRRPRPLGPGTRGMAVRSVPDALHAHLPATGGVRRSLDGLRHQRSVLAHESGLGVLSPVLLLCLALSTVVSLPYLVDRLVAPSWRAASPLLATLVFPLARVAAEYAQRDGQPGRQHLRVAGGHPARQPSADTGGRRHRQLRGQLPDSLVRRRGNGIWQDRPSWRRPAAVFLFAVLAVVVAGGGMRLAFFAPSGPTVRVAASARRPRSWPSAPRC